jgi:hypothetical protein
VLIFFPRTSKQINLGSPPVSIDPGQNNAPHASERPYESSGSLEKKNVFTACFKASEIPPDGNGMESILFPFCELTLQRVAAFRHLLKAEI